MVAVIECVAMPAAAGSRVRDGRLFCYSREEFEGEGGEDSVQVANHTLQIVDKLTEGGGTITKGEPPRGAEYQPLWRVEIQVVSAHRVTASYRADYRKEPGCPTNAVGLMMDVYRAVKRVMKAARKDLKARREKKKQLPAGAGSGGATGNVVTGPRRAAGFFHTEKGDAS